MSSIKPGPLGAFVVRPAGAIAAVAIALGMLSGCAIAPDKPQRPAVYDFGPGATASRPATRQAPLPALVLPEVEAAGAFDGTAMLYRLAYADAQQLRPYAQARWSMPPAALLRQRVREGLGVGRAVLSGGDAPAALTLRLELEEFTHVFESPQRSAGLLRLRATLLDTRTGTGQLVAQREVVVQREASTPDAPGGVRALTACADAAVEEVARWLAQTPVPR